MHDRTLLMMVTVLLTPFVLTTAHGAQNDLNEVVMRPVISEELAPVEAIAPVAADSHVGEGFLRKPPGSGPFPAVVLIHGGLSTWNTERLREFANHVLASRFLAAGYVVASITYRSRAADPQSAVSLTDSLAAVDYLKQLSYVDANSVVIRGTSGGGDLALEVAAATSVAAVAPEEPASMIMSGVFGPGDTPGDLTDYVSRYRTANDSQTLADKIERISSPILIIQGDGPSPLNQFNAEILIPELRAANKSVEVITYAGEPHSFAYYNTPQRTPRPVVALAAFEKAETFFREHVRTQPTPIDPALVDYVPVD